MGTVHAISSADLPDVAKMLRNLAECIEKGDYGRVSGAALVLDAETIDVFGFGQADAPATHYLLGLGQHKLAAIRCKRGA